MNERRVKQGDVQQYSSVVPDDDELTVEEGIELSNELEVADTDAKPKSVATRDRLAGSREISQEYEKFEAE